VLEFSDSRQIRVIGHVVVTPGRHLLDRPILHSSEASLWGDGGTSHGKRPGFLTSPVNDPTVVHSSFESPQRVQRPSSQWSGSPKACDQAQVHVHASQDRLLAAGIETERQMHFQRGHTFCNGGDIHVHSAFASPIARTVCGRAVRATPRTDDGSWRVVATRPPSNRPKAATVRRRPTAGLHHSACGSAAGLADAPLPPLTASQGRYHLDKRARWSPRCFLVSFRTNRQAAYSIRADGLDARGHAAEGTPPRKSTQGHS
jgi:hypothetical protein